MTVRRILVTGGSKGIGLAIASALAAAGQDVAVFSRTPPPADANPLPNTGRLRHLAGDLRSPASVAAVLVRWLDDVGGPPDILVYSAVAYGSDRRRPLQQCTVDEWDAAQEVNARGLLLVLRVVLPPMLSNNRGLVVGISSDVAAQPGPGRIPYAASKAAAHAIVCGLAEELTGSGVTVLELQPTQQVDTPGIRGRRPPDFVPIGYSTAQSFAPPARWLLTDNVKNHHGRCLSVDPAGRLLDAHGLPVA